MTTQTIDSALLQTDFPELELFASGKVRDVYQVGSDHLLFVATDRISAFDYVLATGIPHKGRVLTQLSLFWFEFLKDVVPNHLVTADVNRYPAEVKPYADQLRGRSMLVTACGNVSGRVRGARLPIRLGMERIQSFGKRLRHQAADRTAGVRATSGADLHSRNKGHNRARRKYFVRAHDPTSSIPKTRASFGT